MNTDRFEYKYKKYQEAYLNIPHKNDFIAVFKLCYKAVDEFFNREIHSIKNYDNYINNQLTTIIEEMNFIKLDFIILVMNKRFPTSEKSFALINNFLEEAVKKIKHGYPKSPFLRFTIDRLLQLLTECHHKLLIHGLVQIGKTTFEKETKLVFTNVLAMIILKEIGTKEAYDGLKICIKEGNEIIAEEANSYFNEK